MRNRVVGVLLTAVLATRLASAFEDVGVSDRHPVYVGAKTCAQCHAGPACGHQFSRWRASAHASAYASLWSPAARKIARLSGITEEPQEAAVCLGCHATAANAESWEKEVGFRLADGVQCEKCHGPGSEYMAAEVMMDRERAMRAGLKMPSQRDCMICHNVKGSHVAVLGSPEFNFAAGMQAIAHPTPNPAPSPTTQPLAETDRDPVTVTSAHQFAGVMACAACHSGPMMNYQFSKWRLSRHARAYAVLGLPAGYEIARQEGVVGDPQGSPQTEGSAQNQAYVGLPGAASGGQEAPGASKTTSRFGAVVARLVFREYSPEIEHL